ncbi:hypothetical protein BJ138DRAFT_1152931 [Hygrophoropsis aurantiaca]|uniref:Uncharacterized protein n=1 Tax=Hygrophoropsis aurantiaca TaxID=72124 RepID=A0ACB8ABB1_9AGAM|nr:hypothetical protein BJ138DRAFT_1152931 [Hygrophoropsis aurantiaca]
MPSIFSRSRTNSSPAKKSAAAATFGGNGNLVVGEHLDEFGRVNSRGSSHTAVPLTFSGKKDKEKERKKAQDGKLRKTLSSPKDKVPDDDPGDLLAQIPDGSFLLLDLDRPRDESGEERIPEHDYGYLSYERHVTLGLDEVARLVDVVATELGSRCLTTPFIFSTLALDIQASAIKRLIRTFLDTCANPSSAEAEQRWRDEARFAGPHELGMCLRWGLARVVRVVAGQAVRGLISWDHYIEFRDSEAALNYPPTHFATFLPNLPPVLNTVLLTLLSLLIRLTAHSSSSGHTPPTLSPLFGPLLFGLGPATLAFHHTYIHYLRAVNAMEHIMLAFIRWQDAPKASLSPDIASSSAALGSATSLGVPKRLKEWIRGYPAMLPFLHVKNKQERPQARRGARTVRIVSVRRNVRMYSPDLVKTAAGWAQSSRLGSSENGLAGSKEWERIAPSTLKLQPRYSEGYKKRMDLPTNFHPYTGPSMSSVPSTTSSTSSTTSDDGLGIGLGLAREGEDRFGTLAELKWGEFEAMGFGTLAADEKKLQFDLTEGARAARSAKRNTLNWNDFSASGFSRSDAPLNATLQFSTPVAHTISSWPSHNATITKKLKKNQRALPPFGWDTEPVMGNEEMIEEAFLDVFCDLVYGGGWMDIERGEETDRECNWALIEFKSLPIAKTSVLPPLGTDPRTSSALVLFEEFVPLEYRQQLAKDSGSKRRLPFLFSPSGKSKQWKPAPTLNGRPYVVGHVPRSPSYREVEFEGLLRSNGGSTKVLSLSKPAPPLPPGAMLSSPTSTDRPHTPRPVISSPLYVPPAKPQGHILERTNSDTPLTPGGTAKKSRFRIPVPSPGGARRSGIIPAEYSTVDFETRMASYSDDEYIGPTALTAEEKQERRMSRDDAWVDILVATHNRRMGAQEAERRPKGRSDPEIASQEVAQVLAGVRARSPLSDEEEERTAERDTEPVVAQTPDPDHSQQDPDIDSVMSYPTTKRLGYFDLHPERRPGGARPQPQTFPAVESDDEEDIPDEAVYGAPERPPSLPPKSLRVSVDTVESEYPTTTGHSPVRDIEVPEFSNGEARREEKEKEHSRAESTTLPMLLQQNVPEITPTKTPSPPRGKTAALIEMYREREQKSTASPSRLPVRSSSLPLKEAALPPVPSDIPSPSPSPTSPSAPPPIIEAPEPEPEDIPEADDFEPDPEHLEPPQLLFETSGRDSPGRYVHGAPLHNVMEEEEED